MTPTATSPNHVWFFISNAPRHWFSLSTLFVLHIPIGKSESVSLETEVENVLNFFFQSTFLENTHLNINSLWTCEVLTAVTMKNTGCHILWEIGTDISEERTTFIFRVGQYALHGRTVQIWGNEALFLPYISPFTFPTLFPESVPISALCFLPFILPLENHSS
jgi:hypothetical protein